MASLSTSSASAAADVVATVSTATSSQVVGAAAVPPCSGSAAGADAPFSSHRDKGLFSLCTSLLHALACIHCGGWPHDACS